MTNWLKFFNRYSTRLQVFDLVVIDPNLYTYEHKSSTFTAHEGYEFRVKVELFHKDSHGKWHCRLFRPFRTGYAKKVKK